VASEAFRSGRSDRGAEVAKDKGVRKVGERVESGAFGSGESEERTNEADDERRKKLREGGGVDNFSRLSSEHPIEEKVVGTTFGAPLSAHPIDNPSG
jgi:hypothetical protein